MSTPTDTAAHPVVDPLDDVAVGAAVQAALAQVAAAADLDALRTVRLAHAGDRSPLAVANRAIGSLAPQQRKDAGQRVGAARRAVTEAITRRQAELEAERDERALATERVDVTLPWWGRPPGARHPLTSITEHVIEIFTELGYDVEDGPEAEAEWYNFDALNIPPDHPAREMTDTFFVEAPDSGVVLRTHTSPVQARAMLTRRPPLAVICPGRTYRTDELDATHTPAFSQVEGLFIDEGVTMADLKGTLDHFAERMFGDGIVTRIRPAYFPFTEPSAEVDVECFACRGASVGNPDRPCRTCSSEGWIEWGGCGMVNPAVLVACGVDPDRYTGFAFGMGLERTLMFRHGVTDMHDIVEGDVRFTLPFGMEL
jgi:phenylalanyl-tRNA synthetase alpha chain